MAKPKEWLWIVIHRSRGTLQWQKHSQSSIVGWLRRMPRSCCGAWWHLIVEQSKLSKHKNTCLLLSQCCVSLGALKDLDCYQVLVRIMGSHELCDIPLLKFIVVQNWLWLWSSASALASLDLTGVPWLSCVRTVPYPDLLFSGRIPDSACTALSGLSTLSWETGPSWHGHYSSSGKGRGCS